MKGNKILITQNVLEYLEISAKEYPKKEALREEGKSVTYVELMEQSMSVATALMDSDVFGKPVGIYMEKGIAAVCSFFGTVYAGGYYCMLNPELPETRLVQIQEILQLKTVITTDELAEKAKGIFKNCIVYPLEKLLVTTVDADYIQNVRLRMIDADPLYVNFTSGSTGVPKGIVVSHRSVIDFIDHFTQIFKIDSSEIIANQAPFDFDVSVKDIYSTVKTGATLVIVPGKLFAAPAKLMDYLCENKITTMIWAVSALCLITGFHGLDYKTPSSVRKIMFSGEVMPIKHLKQWQEHLPEAVYVNLYGPTEITCNCTYHILEKDRDYSDGIPIGRSFPNEEVFLLDDENRLVTAAGTVGRIFVRGTALALGYCRLSDEKKEAFIQNPLNSVYPETVYETGDLGKYNDAKELMYCGRTDYQVKYMGHRIELEEIERFMAEVEGVNRCFCTFENGKLKGYYDGSIEKAEIYRRMKEALPAYMIPGLFIRLDNIPMTKNGKIDRKRAVSEAEGKDEQEP